MEALTAVLMNLGVTVAAGAVAEFLRRWIRDKERDNKWVQALRCVAAAVTDVYNDEVRDRKASGDRLTSAEIKSYDDMGKKIAQRYGEAKGIDVKEILEEFVPVAIKGAVARFKAAKKGGSS